MSEGWMSCILSAWAQSLLKVGRGSHVKWVPIVFLLLLHPFSPIVIAHPYFILHIPFTLFSPTPGGLGALEALYCVLSKPCRSFLVHCLAYGRRYRSAVCVLASSPAQKDNSYKSWRGAFHGSRGVVAPMAIGRVCSWRGIGRRGSTLQELGHVLEHAVRLKTAADHRKAKY